MQGGDKDFKFKLGSGRVLLAVANTYCLGYFTLLLTTTGAFISQLRDAAEGKQLDEVTTSG
jgi:hypothetical protein